MFVLNPTSAKPGSEMLLWLEALVSLSNVMRWDVASPNPSEGLKGLSSFIDDCCGVGGEGRVIRVVYTQELITDDPVHRTATYVQWS